MATVRQNRIYGDNDSAATLAHFLQFGIDQLNLTIPKGAQEKIITYVNLLNKWNKIHNLTAVRDLRSIFIRHIFDSLAVTSFIQGEKILDFGTGAGFPGIPLALALPEWQFVLLDSASKKTTFLNHVVLALGIKNVEIVTSRIEEYRSTPCFSTIITRATTKVDVILEKTEHLSDTYGQILVMKGKHPVDELKNITKFVELYPIQVPYLDEERHIVIMKKN